jgi:hypothetical protein
MSNRRRFKPTRRRTLDGLIEEYAAARRITPAEVRELLREAEAAGLIRITPTAIIATIPGETSR